MRHSDTVGKISAALSKAQGAMATAAKDAKGNFGKYADLASIWDACREELSNNELAVIQAPGETAERVVTVTTMLSHSSGEWFEETLTIPMSKVDAQGYGSAVTYARRYALAAMVGIAPAEDDGSAAAAIGGDNNAPRQRKPEPVQEVAVAEPVEGWAAWALDIQSVVSSCMTADALTLLQSKHKAQLGALRTADAGLYQTIGKAITERRGALNKTPEKVAA